MKQITPIPYPGVRFGLCVWVVIVLLGLCSVLQGREDLPDFTTLSEEAEVTFDEDGTVMDMLQVAEELFRVGDFNAAERAFRRYLATSNDIQGQMRAFTAIAELYRRMDRPVKAVAVLEEFLARFTSTQDRARALFSLGVLYREMGLTADAISTFYRVLNAIIVHEESSSKELRMLANRTQFEIAYTHFIKGEDEAALRLFNRVRLLDLHPEDRETVAYYMCIALLRSGQDEEAIRQAEEFLATWPDSQLVPELLMLKAQLSAAVGRDEKALETLMQILDSSEDKSGATQENWEDWRRKAGLDFAMRFYQRGDYETALHILQSLVSAHDDLYWQVFVVYRIGLCFERLNHHDRALASFKFVLDNMSQLTFSPMNEMTLSSLRSFAQQRIELAQWRLEMEQKVLSIRQLLNRS